MCIFFFLLLTVCVNIVKERPYLAHSAVGMMDGFFSVVPSQMEASRFSSPPKASAQPPVKATAPPPKLKSVTPGQFKRKRLTPLQKKRVGALAHWRCEICGRELDESYEVDHKIPVSRGGNNDPSNLRALCRGCHGKVTMATYMECMSPL